MKKSAIIGIILLALLWAWLAWGVLSQGVTLYSLLIVAIAGIIIIVPVWRKYSKSDAGRKTNDKIDKRD